MMGNTINSDTLVIPRAQDWGEHESSDALATSRAQDRLVILQDRGKNAVSQAMLEKKTIWGSHDLAIESVQWAARTTNKNLRPIPDVLPVCYWEMFRNAEMQTLWFLVKSNPVNMFLQKCFQWVGSSLSLRLWHWSEFGAALLHHPCPPTTWIQMAVCYWMRWDHAFAQQNHARR